MSAQRHYDNLGFWQYLLPSTQAARFDECFGCFRRNSTAFSNSGRLLVGCWMIFALLLLQFRIAGVVVWSAPQTLFPQINFSRPRWSDLPRFLIQLAWLIFIRQRPPVKKSIRPKRYRENDLRGQPLLFRLAAATRLALLRLKRSLAQRERRAMSTQAAAKANWQDWLLISVVVVTAALCITVPFSLQAQTFFVGLLLFVTFVLRAVGGRFSTTLLIVLSITVSTRYIWWRSNNTLNWDDPLGLFFGALLLFAELYAWVALLIGYFQNIWPLNRNPVPLPSDESLWPSVDIFIPTYNEDLEVVKATIYACLALDWPQNKLEIYLLDDGKRDNFKHFAEEVSIQYLRRPVNNHAKAGNINYALKHSRGEYIAIFDCDHIPTRAFLQVSMGWFLVDPKLALIQTPHHFYSPDPFERNLSNFRQVPGEGNLFYGLIQDGNDLWNGSFFCGSCAVIRRAPLEEIGGIAVETVTEDAHTSLRLHRRGYNSAYLRVPISAGLATETLSAHIGQRIRWARGMAQILRIDNPLLGPGLKWHQRLCYFNAMMHFLSGVPRLIFLTAPLVFLLLHTYVIYASATMLLLYVVPHMVHSAIVNSKLQGKYRYSFWGEVYETVLAWYVARPTMVALFAPHKGKFNVTAKGGKIEQRYYDWVISRPYLILVGLNIAGILWGAARIVYGPSDEISAVVINVAWAGYNLLLLGAATAVASELKQVRNAPRVEVDIPATVLLPSGHQLEATLRDFSLGGMRIHMPSSQLIGEHKQIRIILHRAGQPFVFPAEVVFRNEQLLGLKLPILSTEAMVDYVQCTFARADNWVKTARAYQEDRPGMSFTQISRASLRGYRQFLIIGPSPIPQIYRAISALFNKFASFRPVRISMEQVSKP